MAKVFKVVVRCPVTQMEIDTGIRTSGREVMSSSIYQDGNVDCPHCRQIHSFEANAFLAPEADVPIDSLWRPNP